MTSAWCWIDLYGKNQKKLCIRIICCNFESQICKIYNNKVPSDSVNIICKLKFSTTLFFRFTIFCSILGTAVTLTSCKFYWSLSTRPYWKLLFTQSSSRHWFAQFFFIRWRPWIYILATVAISSSVNDWWIFGPGSLIEVYNPTSYNILTHLRTLEGSEVSAATPEFRWMVMA